MNTLRGVLEILDPQNKHILLDNDLADLLGIKRRFQTINLSNYLVNCDLLDKNENAFNGESSSVLGCFEIVEQPHRQGSDECCYQIPSLDFDYSLCLTSVLDQLLY